MTSTEMGELLETEMEKATLISLLCMQEEYKIDRNMDKRMISIARGIFPEMQNIAMKKESLEEIMSTTVKTTKVLYQEEFGGHSGSSEQSFSRVLAAIVKEKAGGDKRVKNNKKATPETQTSLQIPSPET